MPSIRNAVQSWRHTMRLIKRDQKQIVFRERVVGQDPDGTTYDDWAEESITIQGNMQPLSGKLAAEMYGEKLKYMKVFYTESKGQAKTFVEQFNSSIKGYGAHIYNADEPDYKVISAQEWRHIVIELEAIR